MNSLGYREGIVNQLPVVGAHEGEIEIANLPAGADNEQPFVIDLEGEQLTYVTAFEPYGEDTRGLDEVWFADADTGDYTFFGTEERTLTGPERAMGIARSADSRTNWGENFVDVTRNVFVNADTGRSVELREDSAIRDFIRGDVAAPDGNGTDPGVEPAPDDPDVAYYVLITDEDGTVIDRIPIRPGQDVSIVDPSDDRVADNETAG
jgi:hypothetical protein